MADLDSNTLYGSPDPLKGRLELEKDGKSVKAPEEILLSLAAAKNLYTRLKSNGAKRIQLYAAIDGMIAGKPPYDPKELEEAGLDYVANINMMDAEAIYARSCQSYWNLNYLSQNHFKVVYKTGAPEDATISEILSRNLHNVIKRWKSYSILKAQNASQIVKYGLSAVIWPDERSWKWRVIDTDKLYVPDQAQCDIDQLSTVYVDTDMTVQYLFETYKNLKNTPKEQQGTSACPWNIEELSKLLIRISGVEDKSQSQAVNIADIERRFFAGDADITSKFSDSVSLVSVLQKEYSGKITQKIFHPLIDSQEFLYSAKDQYKSFDEAILIYTASPGEKTLHANRGVGQKIFTSAQAIMRTDCAILDTTRISATPLLQGPATGAQDMQAVRLYPGVVTYIGTSTFQQNNFGANINQLVGASQYFTGKQNANLANSGDDPSQSDKSMGSLSAEQFKFKKLSEFAILKVNINHYYETEDFLAQNIVGKMLRAQKTDPDYDYCEEWKQLCIEEGVPEEVFKIDPKDKNKKWLLPSKWSVSSTRVTGDGSSVAALIALEQFATLVPNMPAEGVDHFNRQVAIHTVGPEHVTAFLGNKTPDEIGAGSSLAGIENNDMTNGQSPIFSPSNQHRSHFVVHMALATDTIQRVAQQELDPVAADNIMNVLIPHAEQHFEALLRGLFDKRFAAGLEANWMQVKNWATQNRSNAARIKQAELKQKIKDQQETQTVMSDAERKDFIAKADEARKDFALQSKEERTAKAEETRGEIMKGKVLLSHQNEQLKIALKDKNEVQEATLEHLRENIKQSNGNTPAPNDIESTTKNSR